MYSLIYLPLFALFCYFLSPIVLTSLEFEAHCYNSKLGVGVTRISPVKQKWLSFSGHLLLRPSPSSSLLSPHNSPELLRHPSSSTTLINSEPFSSTFLQARVLPSSLAFNKHPICPTSSSSIHNCQPKLSPHPVLHPSRSHNQHQQQLNHNFTLSI